MGMKFFILLVLCSFRFLDTQSQDLYRPRDVKQAYTKQTRSFDGRPGSKYWQNYGRYDISLTVLPPDRIIKGTEKICYINNSPDTLRSIVIKLILNDHKPVSARYGNTVNGYLTEGVRIDTFIVNGRGGLWGKDMGNTTWQEVGLPDPLLPRDSIFLDVSWHYPLSVQSGREGMIDSTTFFLAYFYPRIAVYDDYNGWDKVDFTGGPEFYNDFNDYNLTVNVPQHYIVWATGDLLNPDEVLRVDYVNRLKRSMRSDSVIRIASKDDLTGGKITAGSGINAWKFSASNVTDVALGISDHFIWDATSAIVDNLTGRRASMQAAYADTTSTFRNMAKHGAYALNWFSHNWPGVPYPFSKMTAFQGNADMEYPMMVNDSSIPGPDGRRVANHEIAHTWFPFYMGINETRYAFMDEAWATTLELLIAPSYTDRAKAEETFKRGRISQWVKNPAATADLPIITPSYELREAYRTNAYGKASLAYLALKDMLGDALFKKCLLEYMTRWNGKHPLPWDFFFTFNDVSVENLNWFWNNWFFSHNYIDLKIGSVVRKGTSYSVTIENTGGFAIPFDLKVTYKDGSHAVLHQTPEVWLQNPKNTVLNLKSDKILNSVIVDVGIFVDAVPGNNQWTP